MRTMRRSMAEADGALPDCHDTEVSVPRGLARLLHARRDVPPMPRAREQNARYLSRSDLMKAKRTFRYFLPEHGQTAEDAYEVESVFQSDLPRFVAEDAAENYHDAHGGWEAGWPLEIVVLDGEKELGRFSVDRESVPQFRARKLQPE